MDKCNQLTSLPFKGLTAVAKTYYLMQPKLLMKLKHGLSAFYGSGPANRLGLF